MNIEEMFHLSNRIDSTAGPVLVDTAQLPNGKFETMMFRIKRGKVDYSTDIDCVITDNEFDAKRAHKAVIEKWEV